jgi:hypothetical protein
MLLMPRSVEENSYVLELPLLVDDAEDISDVLDYTFAMISNSKSVPYMSHGG